MKIDVITLFPPLVESVLAYGVVTRAKDRSLILQTWNPREFAKNRSQTVDDKSYGGGPGMVMKYQPLYDCLQAIKAQNQGQIIYLSPQGRLLNQKKIIDWSTQDSLILLSGRYEGIDERLIENCVDEEWSLGDYVISGGELAAMVVIDAIARLLPQVLGNEDSASQDSFMNGLLDYPHYTRPDVTNGVKVPSVLLEGNHANIERWRIKQALGRTWLRRPELLDQLELSKAEQQLLDEFIAEFNKQECD